jgi:hypothetical protein
MPHRIDLELLTEVPRSTRDTETRSPVGSICALGCYHERTFNLRLARYMCAESAHM